MPHVSILNDRRTMATAISESDSVSAALRALGLRPAGGNHRAFRLACVRHGLDAPIYQNKNVQPPPVRRRSDDEIFCVGSGVRGDRLKPRMLEAGFPNACAICALGPEWNGSPLALQIDHINGDSADNRRENLRFLCPNCHSQTETFAGKRTRFVDCPAGCGARIRAGARRCRSCRRWLEARAEDLDQEPTPRVGSFRAAWPAATELAAEVERTSFTAVARRLGISDNAVRKHLRRRGLLVAARRA